MSDLKDILEKTSHSKLEHLLNEPETKQVFSMLSQSFAGDLEQAAEKATRGDTSQLMNAIKQLLNDPEGARLIQEMKSKLK